jgi:hypothetical protein
MVVDYGFPPFFYNQKYDIFKDVIFLHAQCEDKSVIMEFINSFDIGIHVPYFNLHHLNIDQ